MMGGTLRERIHQNAELIYGVKPYQGGFSQIIGTVGFHPMVNAPVRAHLAYL